MLNKRRLKGVEQGQIGERNKTIILLRVSTITQPRPKGRGKWWAQRFAGEPPQLFIAMQRTQQNDKGFVAFGGVGSDWPPGDGENVLVSSMLLPSENLRWSAHDGGQFTKAVLSTRWKFYENVAYFKRFPA